MKKIALGAALSLTLVSCADQPDPSTTDELPDDGEIAPPTIDPSSLHVISGRVAREILRTSSQPGGPQSTLGNRAVAAVAALPTFSYTVTAAQDGRTYSGQIVGQDPTTGASTTVPTVIIPVILRITQNGTTFVFDPTSTDPGCLGASTASQLLQASPMFNNAPFTMNGQNVGTTQFGDAMQRGEFFNQLSAGSNYHVLLSPSVGQPLIINLNAGAAGNRTAIVRTSTRVQCGSNATVNPAGKLGIANVNTIDPLLQNYIATHNINASQFPLFVTYNAAMSAGSANVSGNCCILGFHNALGTPGQTYGIAEFEGRNRTFFSGAADIASTTHEVAEWLNDPSGGNPTPAWGQIGQVGGCQGNLEVGDPLSGTFAPSVTLNGFTYHLQEQAFFSWFYGGASRGAGGKFSTNGTFAGSAKLCPPGGTN